MTSTAVRGVALGERRLIAGILEDLAVAHSGDRAAVGQQAVAAVRRRHLARILWLVDVVAVREPEEALEAVRVGQERARLPRCHLPISALR